MKMNINKNFSQFQTKIVKKLVEKEQLQKESQNVESKKGMKKTVSYEPKATLKDEKPIADQPTPSEAAELPTAAPALATTPAPAKTQTEEKEPINNPPAPANSEVMPDPETIPDPVSTDSDKKYKLPENGATLHGDVSFLAWDVDFRKAGYSIDEKSIEKIDDKTYSLTYINNESGNKITVKVQSVNGDNPMEFINIALKNNEQTDESRQSVDDTDLVTTSQNNADGTTTETTKTKNGELVAVTTKDKDGNIKTIEKYDSNGRLVTTVKFNEWEEKGQFFACVYDAKGNRIAKNYYYDKDYTKIKSHSEIKDGQFISQTNYDENGEISSVSKIEYDANGVRRKVSYYEADGKTLKSVYEFASDGQTKIKVTYYEKDGKNIKSIVKYEYNSDGSYKTRTTDSKTGAIRTTEYDAAGNAKKSGRQSLKGYVKNSFGTMSLQAIYDGIVNGLDYNNAGKEIPLRHAFDFMGYDTYGPSFLEAAIVNPKDKNGNSIPHVKPHGATKSYNSYLDTDYAEIIKRQLKAVHDNYGYEYDEVVGYLFPSSSDTSRAIENLMRTRTLKSITNGKTEYEEQSFLEKNLIALASGKNLPINFNTGSVYEEDYNGNKVLSNPDLYYALGNVSISASELVKAGSNRYKLKLTLTDVYDFNPAYIDKVTNGQNSFGTALNAIGAAAMKDGELKPYFEVFELEITLNSAQIQQLKDAGIIS